MNRIEMYTSSVALRSGLHRVLATAHALVEPLADGSRKAWFEALELAYREPGRLHQLGLPDLARVYADPHWQHILNTARQKLGLASLDFAEVKQCFAHAEISNKAHNAHLGRDVYGSVNKRLWDLVCLDFGQAVAERFGRFLGADSVVPDDGKASDLAVAQLEKLLGFDTGPTGSQHTGCAVWLEAELKQLGFDVTTITGTGTNAGAAPILLARRPSQGLQGHMVFYGHYDKVEPPRLERWVRPPTQLTRENGRLYACGVADNQGPLACRLAALKHIEKTPALTWIIQGEEETGSALAHQKLPDIMAAISADLWLDETGYHDHEDGTLRLLARVIGKGDKGESVDAPLAELITGLAAHASRWGVAFRHEQRGLNKAVIDGGCPFNRNLPAAARYLAVGVNDSLARIHRDNESLPEWTFPLHTEQLDIVFHWVHALGGDGVAVNGLADQKASRVVEHS